MNKKVYLQPQIKCAPLPMESLLASLSGTEGGNNLGDSKTVLLQKKCTPF